MEYANAVRAAEEAGEEPPPREGFVSCGCFPDRINGIWTFTSTWVRTFPTAVDPGMEALRQTLSLLLGLPIDYYVLVDMAGFVDLVDALGGLDIYVTETMDVGFSPAKEGEDPVVVTIAEPGTYHLDGHQALAFVRNRTNTNDAARMRRQRCTLRALAAETRAGHRRHPVLPDRPRGAGERHLQHPPLVPARPDRVRPPHSTSTTSPRWCSAPRTTRPN